MPLEQEAARIIDEIVAKTAPLTTPLAPSQPDSAPSKAERLVETYARDQSLVDELKRLYQGSCQICGSAPFNMAFGNIAEGHHIKWLCRGGEDALNNMILLCPNHHAAIHLVDPEFDFDRLVFKFGVKEIPVRLNRHLRPS